MLIVSYKQTENILPKITMGHDGQVNDSTICVVKEWISFSLRQLVARAVSTPEEEVGPDDVDFVFVRRAESDEPRRIDFIIDTALTKDSKRSNQIVSEVERLHGHVHGVLANVLTVHPQDVVLKIR